MVILLIVVSGILLIAYKIDESTREVQDPLKRSPFSAVRWEEFQPQVKVGEQWYRLVSFDEVPAEEIVAFSRQTYEDLWQKRFEEDLIELLIRMGHPPGDTVKLVVQPLESSETQVLEEVPLTAENREAIWEASQASESKDSP